MGFKYAFKAGISFGKDDLVIPENKEQLIEELIPQVVDSFTLNDLIEQVSFRLKQEYQSDFDMLVEDALTFNLIQDEEEIE